MYTHYIESHSLCTKLLDLKARHQALVGDISGLQQYTDTNQLQMQRLKKQTLNLQRQIACIENMLIPDLNA